MNLIEFRIETVPEHGAPSVSPVIDGASLSVLARRYEEGAGYSPPGGYGGLVPAYFHFGPLRQHLAAASTPRRVEVLACSCGEVGCWPLQAEIVRIGDVCRWAAFRQPHRPERTYEGFGPFEFGSEQYASALEALEGRLRL